LHAQRLWQRLSTLVVLLLLLPVCAVQVVAAVGVKVVR